MEDKSMTRKLNLLWISVAVIAAAAIFKDRIVELVNNIFDKISLD